MFEKWFEINISIGGIQKWLFSTLK